MPEDFQYFRLVALLMHHRHRHHHPVLSPGKSKLLQQTGGAFQFTPDEIAHAMYYGVVIVICLALAVFLCWITSRRSSRRASR
jgi:hypothetical protein